MLVVHLLLGLLSGLGAALLGVVMDFSPWAVLGYFVLGSNLGLLASALMAYLAGSRARLHRRRRNTDPQAALCEDAHSTPPGGRDWAPTRR